MGKDQIHGKGRSAVLPENFGCSSELNSYMVEVRGRTLHRGPYPTRHLQGGFAGMQSQCSGREYCWILDIVVAVFQCRWRCGVPYLPVTRWASQAIVCDFSKELFQLYQLGKAEVGRLL